MLKRLGLFVKYLVIENPLLSFLRAIQRAWFSARLFAEEVVPECCDVDEDMIKHTIYGVGTPKSCVDCNSSPLFVSLFCQFDGYVCPLKYAIDDEDIDEFAKGVEIGKWTRKV